MFGYRGKKSRNMKITAYVLLFGFLFQPLVVHWASPWLNVNKKTGITEVSCALKGEASHHLQSDAAFTNKLSEGKYCPALKLVDMADSTLHLAVPQYHPQTLYVIDLIDVTAISLHRLFHYNAYLTRAPPFIS